MCAFLLQDFKSLTDLQGFQIAPNQLRRRPRRLDEVNFSCPAAERLDSYRSGSGEQVQPHGTFQRLGGSSREHVEESLAETI